MEEGKWSHYQNVEPKGKVTKTCVAQACMCGLETIGSDRATTTAAASLSPENDMSRESG